MSGEKKQLGKREFYPNKASVVAEALKENGVEMALKTVDIIKERIPS